MEKFFGKISKINSGKCGKFFPDNVEIYTKSVLKSFAELLQGTGKKGSRAADIQAHKAAALLSEHGTVVQGKARPVHKKAHQVLLFQA